MTDVDLTLAIPWRISLIFSKTNICVHLMPLGILVIEKFFNCYLNCISQVSTQRMVVPKDEKVYRDVRNDNFPRGGPARKWPLS